MLEPTNPNSAVAQTYGYPMNDWCVGSVTNMAFLFSDLPGFNEDIRGWETAQVKDSKSIRIHRVRFPPTPPSQLANGVVRLTVFSLA